MFVGHDARPKYFTRGRAPTFVVIVDSNFVRRIVHFPNGRASNEQVDREDEAQFVADLRNCWSQVPVFVVVTVGYESDGENVQILYFDRRVAFTVVDMFLYAGVVKGAYPKFYDYCFFCLVNAPKAFLCVFWFLDLDGKDTVFHCGALEVVAIVVTAVFFDRDGVTRVVFLYLELGLGVGVFLLFRGAMRVLALAGRAPDYDLHRYAFEMDGVVLDVRVVLVGNCPTVGVIAGLCVLGSGRPFALLIGR